jgi:hypothetical protein
MVGCIFNRWTMNNSLSNARISMNMVILRRFSLKIKPLKNIQESGNRKLKSESMDWKKLGPPQP